MVDLMLSIFSKVLQVNMRDHHDIPFALPLLFFIFLGFLIMGLMTRRKPPVTACRC